LELFVARGNIDWFNRHIAVGGSLAAPPNDCARVEFEAFSGSQAVIERRTVCDTTTTYGFDMTLDIPGGPQDVIISLWRSDSGEATGPWTFVGADGCERDKGDCQTL